MNVLDLCSGIGGFSLGLEWAGMQTIAFCEKEPYPLSKLKKNWPHIPRFRDIYKLNKKVLDNAGLKSIQLISAGFPCQPYSVAGKQRGKEDDRDLWPEVFRLIKEIKPEYFIGENVAGFISMALDNVLSDLESEGYKCEVFVLPACSVGGIHRRDRVWIVANSNNKRLQRRCKKRKGFGVKALFKTPIWSDIPPPYVCSANDGIPERMARLKALGNAVVPQIPELIGRAIMEIENDLVHSTLKSW